MSIPTVSPEQIKTYQDDGVVCLRGVIGQDWLDLLAEAFEEAEAQPGEHDERIEEGGRFFLGLNVWRSNDKARRFITQSPLAGLAAQLMGAGGVSMYGDHLLLKDPGCRTATPWHQDLPFFPLSGDQIGAFWVGLDPVTQESGAVQFVRGSHKWDGLFMTSNIEVGSGSETLIDAASIPGHEKPAGYEDYRELPDVDGHRDDYDIISYDLEPGDCTFHNVRMLHGAGGNARLDRPRRGWSIRMCGDTTTYYNRPTHRDYDAPALPDGAPVLSDIYPRLWP